MLKKLLELLRTQVFLSRDLHDNKEAIAKMRNELDELADSVRKLQFEVQNVREEGRHEREKAILRIENTLLKLDRQLPPAKEAKKGK